MTREGVIAEACEITLCGKRAGDMERDELLEFLWQINQAVVRMCAAAGVSYVCPVKEESLDG